ncbi:MAG: molybdate ABC transporter substrate-binding protein, partial [Mycobacterium sp.]
MRRICVLTGLMSLILVANLTGCGSKPSSTSQPSPVPIVRTIVVFAAASLKPTFTQIAEQFDT